MQRQEIIISDLAEAVKEKENLSDTATRDFWEIVSYETAEASGKGIIAFPKALPKPITLEPKLIGWYKIYVCMANVEGGNYIEVKLSKDEFGRVMTTGRPKVQWVSFEKCGESYWKAADMTGQSILIAKPDNQSSYTASLLWMRFVPMNDMEVEKYLSRLEDKSSKTMYAHVDEDFTGLDLPDYENPHDYCRCLYHLKDSDVEIVAQEVSDDLDELADTSPESYVSREIRGNEAGGIQRVRQRKNYYEKRREILTEEIAYAHKHDMKFFAVHRMGLSSFAFPFATEWNQIKFVNEHPEFYCESRTGKKISFLSYAYKEVRDYMMGHLKRVAQYGIDGITLVFTRGVHVMYEEPVRERFVKKFGDGVDIRRLPGTDPRVTEIKSDVMTDFMKELRTMLDALARESERSRIKVYIAAYYSAEESKAEGIDVERFAREGLIDGVIQGMMTMWEETDDVLDEDGLINLEKYDKKAATEYVTMRAFGNHPERTFQGLETYNRIAAEYGIRLYSEIQWENSVKPQDYVEMAKKIYENSKGGIALWDCYPARVKLLPEWYCTSQLGSMEHINRFMEDDEDYDRVHKVLAYNGQDISICHPMWRG